MSRAYSSYFDKENKLFVFTWEGTGQAAGSYQTKVMDMDGNVNISMWRDYETSIRQTVDGYLNGQRGNIRGAGATIDDPCNENILDEIEDVLYGYM